MSLQFSPSDVSCLKTGQGSLESGVRNVLFSPCALISLPILFFSFISYFTKGKTFYKKDLEFLMSPHYILQSNQPLVWIALYIETTSSWLYTFALELEKGCHETLVSHHNSSRRSPDSKMWGFIHMNGTEMGHRNSGVDYVATVVTRWITRLASMDGGSQWHRYAVRGAYGDSYVSIGKSTL